MEDNYIGLMKAFIKTQQLRVNHTKVMIRNEQAEIQSHRKMVAALNESLTWDKKRVAEAKKTLAKYNKEKKSSINL